MDVAGHPTTHRTPATTKSYPSPNVNSAEAEKPSLREKPGRGKGEVGYRSRLTTKACNIYIPLLNLQSVCSYILSFHLYAAAEGWGLLAYLITTVTETQAHKLTWGHIYKEKIRILTQFCCPISLPCFIKPWPFTMSFPPGRRSIVSHSFEGSVCRQIWLISKSSNPFEHGNQPNRHIAYCICFDKHSFVLIIYGNTKSRLVDDPAISCQSNNALEKSLNHWPLKSLLRSGAKPWWGFLVENHLLPDQLAKPQCGMLSAGAFQWCKRLLVPWVSSTKAGKGKASTCGLWEDPSSKNTMQVKQFLTDKNMSCSSHQGPLAHMYREQN